MKILLVQDLELKIQSIIKARIVNPGILRIRDQIKKIILDNIGGKHELVILNYDDYKEFIDFIPRSGGVVINKMLANISNDHKYWEVFRYYDDLKQAKSKKGVCKIFFGELKIQSDYIIVIDDCIFSGGTMNSLIDYCEKKDIGVNEIYVYNNFCNKFFYEGVTLYSYGEVKGDQLSESDLINGLGGIRIKTNKGYKVIPLLYNNFILQKHLGFLNNLTVFQTQLKKINCSVKRIITLEYLKYIIKKRYKWNLKANLSN